MNTAARERNYVPLLTDISLFRGLSGEQLRFLAADCFPREASKGRVVCEKGEMLHGFYAVREGRVKLALLSSAGSERVVQIVLAGETFGEALGLIERPSPVYAQTLSDSKLLFFRAERVWAATARWPTLGALFLRLACDSVHEVLRDLDACCLHSALQRVAGYLLDNLDGHERAESPGIRSRVVLPAGKAIIASRLNLTPETLSRELRYLTGKGAISVDRCIVHIHDVRQLRDAAARD